MTKSCISTDHLVAQLMMSMNRLLNDVNQVLDTETIVQDSSDENTIMALQPETGDEFCVEKTAVTLHRNNNVQESTLPSDKNIHAHNLYSGIESENVQISNSLDKKNSEPSDASKDLLSQHVSVASHDTNREEMKKYNPSDSIEGAEVADKVFLRKPVEQLAEKLAPQDLLRKSVAVKELLKQASSHVQEKKLQTEILSEHVAAMPSPVGKIVLVQKINHSGLTSSASNAERTPSNREYINKQNSTPVVVLNPIRLRSRTAKIPSQIDDVVDVTSTGNNDERFDVTSSQVPTVMNAVTAPRSIQNQSSQISQSIDPILERAHQISNQSFSQDSLDDDLDIPVSRVQNTFNVNVAMNQDTASASLDRELLQTALLDMLRTAARRQGLEI